MEQEIVQSEWENFLKSFGRKHKSWLVTVSRNQDEIIKNEPLNDLRMTEEGVSIAVGKEIILIDALLSVRLIKTQAGADQSIDFVSDDGTTTITINRPTLPEMVDGILI